MKKKILIISSRTVNINTLDIIRTIMDGFKIEHCFLAKEEPVFTEEIDGIIFNHDIDYFEITRSLRLLEKDIPTIRIYPSFWGYSEIQKVAVKQTWPEAANFFRDLFK